MDEDRFTSTETNRVAEVEHRTSVALAAVAEEEEDRSRARSDVSRKSQCRADLTTARTLSPTDSIKHQ